MNPSSPSLRRLLIVSTASLGLLAAMGPARALTQDEAIKTATAACLDSAGKQGWRTDLAKVISSRAIDADKVEVVFDLTKDGTNTARLTCPYSISKGVGAGFGGAATSGANTGADTGAGTAAATDASAVPVATDSGTLVDGNRAWWALLPLGLGLLSWGALRGRNDGNAVAYGDGTSGSTSYTGSTSYAGSTATAAGTTYGTTTSRNIVVEANAHDGQLEVREQPDITAGILRRVRNGDTLQLTGHRRHDWLEVVNGGWVRDIDLRYDRTAVRFS
jgi:hypothetical protein